MSSLNGLFSWERFFSCIPTVLPYVVVNFQIVIVATVLGVLLGFAVALIRIKRVPVLYQITTVYISFMRGTPMLVQLFLILYGLPTLLDPILGTNIGRTWETIYFGYVTFVLNQGAFLSAIFYTAIQSVSKGQTEAGYSVGLTEMQTYTRIVIPQSLRTALPPFGADLLGLFQNASLVFTIGVIDLMGRAQSVGAVSGHTLEAYLLVAIVYIVISIIIRVFFAKVDSRLVYGRESSI